ncbi:MAG: OmpA family protein [Deltaproteobacteria bacterium]|nr:OmpA family protein [Deltaproteobacteria bacterium]
MNRLCVVLAALLSGCVTQGTYDALQKDRDTLKADLDRTKAESAETQERLEKASRELSERIARVQAELEKTVIERDSIAKTKAGLESDLSTMLKDKSRLQASVEEMKTALAELSRRKAEADARLAEFKGLLNRFKSLIDAGKLQVKMVDGRMVVALASDVLFASGSSKLSKDGEAAIAEVAQLLAEIPDRKFQVEGHTDNVPIKSAQYPSNWELAAARSLTVVKTMVEAGLPPDRISAASYGEFKPAKANDSSEGKASNRRIEIVVMPDLSSLPGFDELKRVSGQ